MASVALLHNPNTEQDVNKTSTAFIPRKKTAIASVPLRSRFTKAKPKIGRPVANKPKETTSNNEKGKEVPEIEVTKWPAVEEKKESDICIVSTKSDALIVSDIIVEHPSTDLSEGSLVLDSEKLPTEEVARNTTPIPVLLSSSNITKDANQPINETNADSEVVQTEKLNASSIAEKCKIPTKPKIDWLKSLKNPDSPIDKSPQKEVQHPVDASKSSEYPTIRSILNSPRKRYNSKKQERKRFRKIRSEEPFRSSMTMADLIYWNPNSSPMKGKPVQSTEIILPPEPVENNESELPKEEEEDQNTMAPKVIINENGEIIIDESSLVVRRKEPIIAATIIENENTTYSSFRKRNTKHWNKKETTKFYKTLSLVGSDFALMENMFKVNGEVTRSRRELKLKFKREEKINMDLLHKVMYESQTFDPSILEESDEDDGRSIRSSAVDSVIPEVDDDGYSVHDLSEATVDRVVEKPVKKRGRKKKSETAQTAKETMTKNTTEPFITRVQRRETFEEDEADENQDEVLNSLTPEAQKEKNSKQVSEEYDDDNNDLDFNPGPSEKKTNYGPKRTIESNDDDDNFVYALGTKVKKEKKKPNKKTPQDDEDFTYRLESTIDIVPMSPISKRFRKSKSMPDFVTDGGDSNDKGESDDDTQSIKVVIEQEVQDIIDNYANHEIFPGEESDSGDTSQQADVQNTDTSAMDVICVSVPNTEESSQNFFTAINTVPEDNILTDAEIKQVSTERTLSTFESLPTYKAFTPDIEAVVEVVTEKPSSRRGRKLKTVPNVASRPSVIKNNATSLVKPTYSSFTPDSNYDYKETASPLKSNTRTYSKKRRLSENLFSDSAADNIVVDVKPFSNEMTDVDGSMHDGSINADSCAQQSQPTADLFAIASSAIQRTEQNSSVMPGIAKQEFKTPGRSQPREVIDVEDVKPDAIDLQCDDSNPQLMDDCNRVMLMTKSPNNENILHLFMLQSPSQR